MFSNAYSGSSTVGQGEFDPSLSLHEQTYGTVNGMIMAQPGGTQKSELPTQESQYALPPISQDFARPLLSETRRPATSAGVIQRLMSTGSFTTNSPTGVSTHSDFDQSPELHQNQSEQTTYNNMNGMMLSQSNMSSRPEQIQPSHTSSGYNVPSAQANYAHLTLDQQQQQQQRRQGEMSNYNGTFAHTLDGIDPNLTGMLNYMDITRRFSVPTLTNAPFKYPTTPASATAAASGMNSARSMNNVRFNPIKAESGHTVSTQYDNAQQRPGSSGGPIFATDYRMGMPGSFDPAIAAPNGFFGSNGEMTPQQQQQLYTLQSAASGVFPSTSYSSNGSMIDHRNSSYSSVSLDSTRHDSLTDNSRNPSLPDIYFNHHLRRPSMDARPDLYLHQQQMQRRPSTGHTTTLAEAAAHQMALGDRGDDPLSGPAHRKRPRRKFDQIERLYLCGYEGCNKSYGTLNHLNAHVSMQKHGQKRRPEEFKEIRAAWRRRKKEEAKIAAEHVATVHGGGVNIEDAEKAAYEAQGKWLAH
ncbi:hypothetical protein QFC24_001868 [Naganishia onofrii]|uniref:Uncharacterized protein n=1 Tax=Naganishia onofrii TaxID=1851511 RepID=A0ACC2XS30_9TREE|nr:hypothetical protein QFC24_001868 [Naganishia onofrii]